MGWPCAGGPSTEFSHISASETTKSIDTDTGLPLSFENAVGELERVHPIVRNVLQFNRMKGGFPWQAFHP